jgi:beta-galactosidase
MNLESRKRYRLSLLAALVTVGAGCAGGSGQKSVPSSGGATTTNSGGTTAKGGIPGAGGATTSSSGGVTVASGGATVTPSGGQGGGVVQGGTAVSGGTLGQGGGVVQGGIADKGGGSAQSGGAAQGGRGTLGGGPAQGGNAAQGGSATQGGQGGTSAGGGTGGQGNRDAGPPDANSDAPATSGPAATPVYNGLRGQDFNAGWKFNRGDVTGGAQSATFNDSSWRSLNVPHDWSIELAFNQSSPSGSGGGFLDGGVGWYRKTFTLDQADSGKKILIQFDGVYMNSQVWINGISLGTRPYGYSSFEYDLTPYVNFGGTSNILAVRVNNNQPTSRWYSGSGIYRHVWLTKVNPVHVTNSGVFVTTPTVSSTSASVSVATEVQNQAASSASVTVTTTISDPNGASVATNTSAASDIAANAKATVSQSLTVANPQLWSTTSPNLYQVKVEVTVAGATVDTYLAPLGFRTATFSATGGFSLNGQTVKLRGVCMHHDLGALGAAVNYRAIERQVEILKTVGVNAIRTSHNPPAPELLDICDRQGILVMDEAFDCWETAKVSNDYHLYFTQWAQTDLQSFVRRDRNHPSVIMWSVGNEIPSPTTATATNLKNWVLAVDTTRPVTWASVNTGNATNQSVAAVLDLQGYNYSESRYDTDHSAHSNWRLFGSETSSAVRSRGIYHTPVTKNILTSSDTQCSCYDNSVVSWGSSAESSYKNDVSRSFISGQFIWTGFDYIGEPTPYPWPAKSSYFGIVDTAGFPKDIYYFYQSHWTTAPMVHILPHWNWSAGTTVTVFAYTNCDSVELFLNDVSLGSKTFASGAVHLEWSVPWASGTLRAEGKRGGAVVATEEVKTAGAAAKLALSADRSTISADGKDLAFITADVQDANGILVPTAANALTFSVTGPGAIVGLDNGNAIDTTSYKGTNRNAFSGKALAIVRSAGSNGAIVVSATASGLTAGSVTVNAQ